MLKKLVIFTLLALCLGGSFYVFKELKKKANNNSPVITAVPKNASIILSIKKPTAFWRNLSETNLIWSHLKANKRIEELDKTLNKIDSIIHLSIPNKNRETVVSIHKSNTNIPDVSIAFIAEQEEYNQLVKSFQQENKLNAPYLSSFSHTFSTPFVILSTNNSLLNKSIAQIHKKESLLQDSSFVKTYKHNKSNFQLIFNNQKVKEIASPYLKKQIIEDWSQNKTWNNLDLILDNDKILLNGLSNLENNTTVTTSKNVDETFLPNYINSKTENALSFEDIPSKVKNTLESVCNCSIKDDLKKLLGDRVSKVEFSDKHYTAYYIKTNSSEDISQKINSLFPIDTTIIDSYNHTLYSIQNSSLNTLLEINVPLYYTQTDSYIVISSKAGLKQLTYQWKKNKHTQPKFYYNDFAKDYLAQQSSFSYYSTFKILSKKISSVLKPEYQNIFTQNIEIIENNFHLAYQNYKLSPTIQHEAFVLKSLYNKDNKNGKLWSLTFDTPIINTPQLLKNHRSKSLDILIQDQNNVIHLINAAGSIKWSKKIDNPIIGNIEQIDIYGNNKYQMVFNTKSSIYIIDINGNHVTGFPIQLNSLATNPVTIFDYENTNNYRFWISCEDLITYNYDKEGKKVTGWSNPKSSSIIKQKYHRTVFNQKDYIYTFSENGEAIFLNRRGEQILNIPQKLLAKKNQIVLQKRATLNSSSFIFIEDSTNKIWEYNLSNTSKEITLDTSKTLDNIKVIDIDNNKFIDYITFNQNSIEIYGLDKTLVHQNEFIENIENASIIVNKHTNKKYISIQKEESEEVLLLDKNLSQLTNSAIRGNKNIGIGDLNSNGKLEVISISNNQTLSAYSIEP